MSPATATWMTRICLIIAAFAICLTIAHDLAKANTKVVDGPVSFVDSSTQSTEVSASRGEAPKTVEAKSAARSVMVSAALGAAVGATGYADARRQRAGLEPIPRLDYPTELFYTVARPVSLLKQASLWGVSSKELLALNPGFSINDVLEPGTKLTVLKRNPWSAKPLSVGPTNRGRIQNGWLMPEGDETSGYFLRDERQRSYATENTIGALRSGFAAYAAKYPDAPRVNIGDFSKRRGGKIKPHASHQSGRDVDIGFVHYGASNSQQHFTRASVSNLDAEKTWFMIKSIIATGEVKSIYVDKFVQRQLYNVAKQELSDEQLALIFSIPKREHSSSALMQHWPGHRNHFHIRFICPENQPRCRK